MDEIRNALLVLPKDRQRAREIFEAQYGLVVQCMERGGRGFYRTLRKVSHALSKIELRFPLSEAKKVLLDGEIYVRRDEFTSQGVIERLARKDIVVKRAPTMEWILFIGYNTRFLQRRKVAAGTRLTAIIQTHIIKHVERRAKRIIGRSGVYEPHFIDIDSIVRDGSRFVDTVITGEILLVIGSFFREIANHVHGVIHIGPFACLPTRIIESIVIAESHRHQDGNERIRGVSNFQELKRHQVLPHVSIEMDGNPLPQVVEARIEAFALQVERLYREMKEAGTP